MALHFIDPHRDYSGSFVEALREGLEVVPMKPEKIAKIETDFDSWWHDQNDVVKPVLLPDGRSVARIPQTTRWLVDEHRFLGRVDVRHALTEDLEKTGGHIGYAVRLSERRKGYGALLLEEGLKVAREIGISKALLTCNDDNLGSIKIIEDAGGILADKISLPTRQVLHRRYWIALP